MSHAYEPARKSRRQDGPRDEAPSNKWTAFVVHTIADIAAAFVGLWILLYVLGVDGGNLFVLYMEDMAYWIAGWSQNIFTVENDYLCILFNYVLPAVVYLFIGHGIAARIRRTDVSQMDDTTMRLTPASTPPRETSGWQPR